MTGRPRLLIIGSMGFVGANLASAVSRFDLCSDDGIDITSAASVRQGFDRTHPEAVVLLAAISDIDRCEREPALAEIVNVNGAANVASECARTGARLVYTSSAAVFDGTKHGYREHDSPTPLSVYGTTKARAEAAIAALLPTAAIVRLSLVIGFGRRRGTNSMLDRLVESFEAGDEVSVPEDEYRNPIDVQTLSEFLLELALRGDTSGVFHLGSSDCVSRFDLVRRLAEKMDYSPDLVIPAMDTAPGRAPRGRDHFLISGRIAAVCGIPIPSSDETLERCLHAIA